MKKNIGYIFSIFIFIFLLWKLFLNPNTEFSNELNQKINKNPSNTNELNSNLKKSNKNYFPNANSRTPVDEDSKRIQNRIDGNKTQNLVPSQSHTLSKVSQQGGANSVAFRNYQGLAVAYGDVLLGQLEEKTDSGFVKIPEIAYWPSAVIPYHIQPNVPHPERIYKALKYLSEKTVLEFVPLDETTTDAIVFEVTKENCLSYVGRISGAQPIYVSTGCEWFHIVHEVLHAVGLFHEHSRPDRDQFLTIQWDHIPKIYHSQFEILPDSLISPWLNYAYDVNSIMHYGSQQLDPKSKDVSLIQKSGQAIPEPREMSALDIQKVNSLYLGR